MGRAGAAILALGHERGVACGETVLVPMGKRFG